MNNSLNIIQKPLITERATHLKALSNQYVFRVAAGASKSDIKAAMEQLFKVKVLDVHVMNIEGKKRRLGRSFGKRQDWRKAIVKLDPKDKISFFEGA